MTVSGPGGGEAGKPPLTKEEILALAPGKNLDVQVAERVIGRLVVEDAVLGAVERCSDPQGSTVWSPLEAYSEDPAAAELVVDHMIAKGHENAIYWADFGGGRFTEPEAICKAALLAMAGEKVELLQ